MSYNPSDYIKDYRFIGRAAQDVAGGVIGFSEEQKQKKQRQEELDIEYKKAEKLASENKNLINTSYKTIRSIASREIDELIKLGSLDEKTGQDMLKTLVKPDKFTTFKDYSTVTGTAFDDLMANIAKLKEKAVDTGIKQTLEGTDQQPAIGFQNPETEAVSGDLSSSMADLNKAAESVQAPAAQGPWAELGEEQQPAIPQQGPVPAMGPLQDPTREEGMRKAAGKYTMDEWKKSLYGQSLTSEADINKQKNQDDKNRLAAEKMDRQKIRDERISKSDELAWLNYYLRVKGMELREAEPLKVEYVKQINNLSDEEADANRLEAEKNKLADEVASWQDKIDTAPKRGDDEETVSIYEDKRKKAQREFNALADKWKAVHNKVNDYESLAEKARIALKHVIEKSPAYTETMEGLKKAGYGNEPGSVEEPPPTAIPSPAPAPRQTQPAPAPAATAPVQTQPAPAPAAAAPNLPPVTADTSVGKMELPGSQKSTVPQYESIEDVKAAKSSGKLKVGDKVRVVINGKLTLIRVK